MNPEDIRKLIGGYATGTLTAAEQKLLFDAALDDQELFDQLAREQSLKEMLEAPGARTRLAAALTPPPSVQWWKKPIPWTLAGTLAAGVLIAVVMLRKPEPRVTVSLARVDSAAPAQAAVNIPPPPSAPPTPEPLDRIQLGDARSRKAEARRDEPARQNAQSPVPAPVGAAEPPAARAAGTQAPADLVFPISQGGQGGQQQAAAIGQGPTIAPPAKDEKERDNAVKQSPAAPAGGGGEIAQSKTVPLTADRLAISGAPAPAPPPATAAVTGAALNVRRAAANQGTLAFDYMLRPDNLMVRPLANGYLTVTTDTTNGQARTLQGAVFIQPGADRNITIPQDAAMLTVQFSLTAPATPGAFGGFVSSETAALAGAKKADARAEVQKDVLEKAGRAQAQPNQSNVVVRLPVPRQ